MKDGDDLAEPHHQRHVVLHDQHGHALVGQPVEDRREAVGLLLVETRCRLVEQQHRGPAGQGPGELQQPGVAGGQRVGPLVGLRRETDTGQQFVGDVRRTTVDVTHQLGGGEDVVAHGERAEQLQALEGAGHPEAGPLVGGHAGDVVTRQQHPTGGGRLQPGEHVEDGGLAGTVGADETGDLPGLDVEVDLVDGHVTAEADRDLTRFEYRHHTSPSGVRAHRRGW